MKTQLPTNVRVGGFEYIIEYVGCSQEVDDDLTCTNLLGQVRHTGSPGYIRVLTTQQPIGILDTLIHEILHAIFASNELLRTAIRPKIGDEAVLAALGRALAVLLIENKWVQMPAHMQPTVRRITQA